MRWVWWELDVDDVAKRVERGVDVGRGRVVREAADVDRLLQSGTRLKELLRSAGKLHLLLFLSTWWRGGNSPAARGSHSASRLGAHHFSPSFGR